MTISLRRGPADDGRSAGAGSPSGNTAPAAMLATPQPSHQRNNRTGDRGGGGGHADGLPKPVGAGLVPDGSISHGRPERRTKRIPVSAARFGTEGRPRFGFGDTGSRSGSITNQSSSDTSGAGMPFR
jgi:hypothetical protein